MVTGRTAFSRRLRNFRIMAILLMFGLKKFHLKYLCLFEDSFVTGCRLNIILSDVKLYIQVITFVWVGAAYRRLQTISFFVGPFQPHLVCGLAMASFILYRSIWEQESLSSVWPDGWVTAFFTHILSDNLVGLCLDYLKGKERQGFSSEGCRFVFFSREGQTVIFLVVKGKHAYFCFYLS